MVVEMSFIREEVRGFASLGEYQRFCHYIEGEVARGAAKERRPADSYHKGLVFGGRWFEDIETEEIWRLVAPDFPFRGLWERVDFEQIAK